MNVETYLEKTLAEYPLTRMKVRADVELQRLVDDKEIVVGDAYYLRDSTGERTGIVCEYLIAQGQSVQRLEIPWQQQ